ncbi:MAG: adenylate/guanylate cyclase domain-containing protein [Bacteroidetes bacterium]|nr:adenylate/guanylate cyclase domain-containing protein [Bacteroidota bacterium]
MSATELVRELHYCYSEFDKIITRYGLEKIKTIGDSYMCAGGLPLPDVLGAEKAVLAALDILDFMSTEMQRRKEKDEPFFEIRIGLHTGPVVAGIVGIKKFAITIFGGIQ